MDHRVILACILGAIGALLILICLFSNGWVTADAGGVTIRYGLRDVEVKSQGFSFDIDLSEAASDEDSSDEMKDFNQAGATATIILWLALGLSLISLGLSVMVMIGKRGATAPMILFLLDGGIVLFASICYVGLTPSFEHELSDLEYGWCVYLVFFGGVLQFIGGVLLRYVVISEKSLNEIKKDELNDYSLISSRVESTDKSKITDYGYLSKEIASNHNNIQSTGNPLDDLSSENYEHDEIYITNNIGYDITETKGDPYIDETEITYEDDRSYHKPEEDFHCEDESGDNSLDSSLDHVDSSTTKSVPSKIESYRSIKDLYRKEIGEGEHLPPQIKEPSRDPVVIDTVSPPKKQEVQDHTDNDGEDEMVKLICRMHSVEEKNPREIAKALNVSAREVRDIIYMHSKSGM